jgi:hypothetical protein
MKRFLLLTTLALVFAVQISKAQLINPGFETWTADLAVPSAMNPNSGNATTGWWDYNVYNYAPIGSSPLSVFRCDTAHSGTYSARIKTVVYTPTSYNIYNSYGTPYIGHPYSDTLGILFNGNVNETASTYKPGFPFTKKITSFSFYYQYAPNGVDTAECRVSLVKNRSLIAGGSFKASAATGSTWQSATINIIYLDTLTPDTMYVLFSSSSLDRKPKPGSTLLIDDVSVPASTGINDLPALNSLSVFPNPSNGKIHLQTNGAEKFQGGMLTVYNVIGEVVYSFKTITGQQDIDLSELPGGVYFLQIKNDQGMGIKKIIIDK